MLSTFSRRASLFSPSLWPRLIHRLMFAEHERIQVCPDRAVFNLVVLGLHTTLLCDYHQIKGTLHITQ